MSDRNALSYYERREQAERSLAAACRDKQIAVIHLDLAERYAATANEMKLDQMRRLRTFRRVCS